MRNKINFFIGFLVITVIVIGMVMYIYTPKVQANKNIESIEMSKVDFMQDIYVENVQRIEKGLEDIRVKSVGLENEKELLVEYKYSVVNPDLELDVYTDKNATEYMLKGNQLVGFIKERNNIEIDKESNVMKSVSKDEILDKVKTYCENNVQNFAQYELSGVSYTESYEQYNVTFVNKLQGYDTLDEVAISIDNKGEIMSFSAPRQGMFDKYDNQVKVDETDINNNIKDILNSKYELEQYNITGKYFNIINGKLVMQCDVEILFPDGNTTLEAVVYYI